ncbi:DUF2752 domain-containing protein [uncultured Flavonifractor sp.]|uniref:DUF2752 domain-containing protein n=1 Tax=uncultured Flavonifractor sp. TaxID=1193534 RepID=UPI00262F9564|nr:DUF2752 domain-containing protein [uncultured Flavonifractor sp.]
MDQVGKKLEGRRLLLAACLVYGLLLLLNVPCLFTVWLGIPCPGCGMRRAVLAALSLDFGAAFRLHPMFWSLPVLAWSIWKNGRLTGVRRLDLALHGTLALGFLAHYAAVLLDAPWRGGI